MVSPINALLSGSLIPYVAPVSRHRDENYVPEEQPVAKRPTAHIDTMGKTPSRWDIMPKSSRPPVVKISAAESKAISKRIEQERREKSYLHEFPALIQSYYS